MQQVNWNQFGLKAESKQKTFEDLCMFLCCRELGITKIEAYHNQPGIETEPFEVNNKRYGFQVKYFENSFDWTQIEKSIAGKPETKSGDKKNKSSDEKTKPGDKKNKSGDEKTKPGDINKQYPNNVFKKYEIDFLFIYTNKDKTLNGRDKTKAENLIESLAKENKAKITYKTEKDIQLKLSNPANFDLAQLFFGVSDEYSFIKNSTSPEILTFLQSSEYLELPFTDKGGKITTDIYDKVFSSTQNVFLVSGHPGSGKTIFMHSLLQHSGGLNKNDKAEMLELLTTNKAVPILVNLKNCATASLENILRERKNDCRVNNQELGFIYLFDGLDELSPEKAENVLLQIHERKDKDTTKKIILSCRTGNTNRIKAKDYFNEITEYQIESLGEDFIDKYFEVKQNGSKLQKLEELKEKNRNLIKDIKDIFLIKLFWDTIEELNESSTSIDLFSRKVDLLLDDPKHRKNIDEINLPNPKREQIIKLNQDISFEFQKKFQFRFSQEELQKLILERFERLDYKSTNAIVDYLADVFFEHSFSDNQEKATTYIYQHRRYQEFFFAQKLKTEYEKNPKILRELNVLSNREFFKELFLKYLRKEYEKENNLAGLLELNLISVYLGDYKGFGADEPYYLESEEFIPALICQNESVFNELLEDENLQIKNNISIDFNVVENQFELWNKDKKEYYSTEYLRSVWGRISFLIENIAPFWKFGKIDIANELKKRADEIQEMFKRYKFSENLREHEYLESPHWEKFESWVYFRIIINGETVKDVFENLIRRNYENFSDDKSFSFEESGKEKLVKSFFRVCLKNKKDELFALVDTFDEYEFLAFLDVLRSTEFLPLFIQTKILHKKIKSFVQNFSGEITDKNSSTLFYKTFFKIPLSKPEKAFAESELENFSEMRDVDWRIRKNAHYKFSIATFPFDNYSFNKLLEKKKDYSYNYFHEQDLYAALFKDFVLLLNEEKNLKAIVGDYFRYIQTHTEHTNRRFPSKEISVLWANIFDVSNATKEVKTSIKSLLIAEKQTFNPYSFFVELNHKNKDLFNKIVNESELQIFEEHLSDWDDDFPSYVERCFILAQWFSDLNPEKAKFYLVKGINDGLLRHNWRKDIIVSYLLVDALKIFWKNNWVNKETLKDFTNKVFNLTLRVYDITDKDHTWEGSNNVIELVLNYDVQFAEQLKDKLIEQRESDYFQNSLITNLLVAKAKQGFSIEEIEKGMFDYRYDYYRNQGETHFSFYMEKFPVYLEVAENDLFNKEEKERAFNWLYENTNTVIEKEYKLGLNKKEKERFEILCKKYRKKFKLSYEEKKEDQYISKPYEDFTEDIEKAKTQQHILEIYAKLQNYILTESENWKILIDKTFEICGNIEAFTYYMESSYYPTSDYLVTNSKFIHFGLAASLQNIETRQETVNYLYRNSGHGGFINVMKAYAINSDRKMCLLLFERYLKFCDFLVN